MPLGYSGVCCPISPCYEQRIFRLSAFVDHMGKVALLHSERRTKASVSEKVACSLAYQAVWRAGSLPASIKPAAKSVMMGNRPNNAGVVRTIALPAHWRWVSTESLGGKLPVGVAYE
jgi:hypothetical protein